MGEGFLVLIIFGVLVYIVAVLEDHVRREETRRWLEEHLDARENDG
jgi:hypothetical protein